MKKKKFEYLYFFDSDDLVDEKLFETTIPIIEKYQANCVIFSSSEFKKSTNSTFYISNVNDLVEQVYGRKQWADNQVLMTSSSRRLTNKIFRYSAIKYQRFDEDLIVAEDKEFLFRNFKNLTPTIVIPDVLYYYRLRKSSLSTRKSYVKHINNINVYLSNVNEYPKEILGNVLAKEIYDAYIISLIDNDKQKIKLLSDLCNKFNLYFNKVKLRSRYKIAFLSINIVLFLPAFLLGIISKKINTIHERKIRNAEKKMEDYFS